MVKTVRATVAAAMCLAAVTFLGGCTKKSPTGPVQTATLLSNPALDGFVGSNGTAVAGGNAPNAGDADAVLPGIGFRQIFSFDLSSIPNGATIESATLQLYQAKVEGAPYATLGNVIVDRMDLGAALDAADFSGGLLASNVGTLSTSVTAEYKSLVVTSSVKADRSSNRPRSEYRLRFSTSDSNNNGITDRVFFADAEDSCCAVNRPPQLVVTYSVD